MMMMMMMIIIIIRTKVLSGPLPFEANVAIDLYPGHPSTNFQNPVSLRLPLPIQSILISVGQVLVDLQVLYTMSELSRSLSADFCVLLLVIAEVSLQLHFL